MPKTKGWRPPRRTGPDHVAAQRGGSPASQRRVALAATALAAVFFVVMAAFFTYLYVHEKPLREGRTTSASAEVLGMKRPAKGTDEVRVRFEVPNRGTVQASIPARRSYADGSSVEVLYDPTDPTLVRTADNWVSSWQPASTLLLLIPVGIGVLALGRASAAQRQLGSPGRGVARMSRCRRARSCGLQSLIRSER